MPLTLWRPTSLVPPGRPVPGQYSSAWPGVGQADDQQRPKAHPACGQTAREPPFCTALVVIDICGMQIHIDCYGAVEPPSYAHFLRAAGGLPGHDCWRG
jgi:hypothetical protein